MDGREKGEGWGGERWEGGGGGEKVGREVGGVVVGNDGGEEEHRQSTASGFRGHTLRGGAGTALGGAPARCWAAHPFPASPGATLGEIS